MRQAKSKSTAKAKNASPKARKSTSSSKDASPHASKQRIPRRSVPRKESALERLGVDLADLEAAPRITDILSSAFSTGKRVPRVQTINFLAASPAAEARAFLEVYRELPVRDRESLPIEAICIKAEVNPLAILGAVLMAAKNLKAQESALKAIMAHPDVVDATVNAAMLVGPNGTADRKILHEAVGFLPTKQGSNIAFNLNVGPGGKKDEDDDSDEVDSFNEAFPTIAGELEGWSENRRLLTEGK